KLDEYSSVLDQAQKLQPSNYEIAIRRSRVAAAIREQKAIKVVPEPGTAVAVQSTQRAIHEIGSRDIPKYSLTVATETDLFSFTSPVQAQSANFGINWNARWSSTLGAMSYRRLGQAAAELASGIAYRLTKQDSLSFSFGQGSHQQIAPLHQMSLDYDHGLKLNLGILRGLELTGHSASIWFEGSQVTVLGGSAIAYLPRDWIWTFTGYQARTDFYGTGSSWSPAASTKLSVPVWSRLRLDAGFGVGAENYSNIDQIGRISARTYLGGAHYLVNRFQDFSVFTAYQQRSHGQTQTSIGGGYGFRF
ncbi:MAG TPA: hypothetical protein VM912_14760, partial [Terriglobales bacterium]|nr:hypothetical protein [Terriglobales bacterium]